MTSNSKSSVNFSVAIVSLVLGMTIGLISGISSAAVTLPIIGGLLSILSGILLLKISELEQHLIIRLCISIIVFCLALLGGLGVGVNYKIQYTSNNPDSMDILKSTGTKDSQADILCRAGNIEALEQICQTSK